MGEQERLKEVEALLGSLRPAASRLDREAVLFDAGRAAGRREVRRWRGATAMLSAALAASVAWHGVTGDAQPSQYVEMGPDEPAAPASPLPEGAGQSPEPAGREPVDPSGAVAEGGRSAPPDATYLHLRTRVLAGGVEAMPAAARSTASADPVTLEEILGAPQRGRRAAPSPRSTFWSILGLGDRS